MGWNGFKILNSWGCLPPFRVTPFWKEGVNQSDGKWVNSKVGAYHWEAERDVIVAPPPEDGQLPTLWQWVETGNFIKVAGDVFVEFDTDTGSVDIGSMLGEMEIGVFNEDNPSPYQLHDDYPDRYTMILSYREFDHVEIDAVIWYRVGVYVVRKNVSLYKYQFGDWIFIRNEKNIYFP